MMQNLQSLPKKQHSRGRTYLVIKTTKKALSGAFFLDSVTTRIYTSDMTHVIFINKRKLTMKKILAILAMAVSTGVFAASATIEYQDVNGVQNTPNDQRTVNLTVREAINQNFTGDVHFSNTWNNTSTSDAVNLFRTEGGLTGATSLIGPLSGYTRVALGQKFTSTTNFTYYSVEPGVTMPLGAGFNAKVGYRFRNAFDTANNDTTRTWRAGLSYDINKTNTVGLGYDSVRGDWNQNIVKVNYTRGF